MSTPRPIVDYARELGVTPDTVRAWAAEGQVKLWQPGGKRGRQFVIVEEKQGKSEVPEWAGIGS